MNNHTNNPAGRLFLVLKKAQKIENRKKVRQGWAEIFETEPNNTSEILRKLGEVNKLPATIRDHVTSLNGVNHELHLKKLNVVEKALSNINFNSSWQGIKKQLDEATVLSIEHCSDLLSQHSSEKALEKKDLDKLKQRVQDFKNELSEYEIDHQLSSLIYNKVNDIERAIFDYELKGTASIKKEVESAFGSYFMQIEVMQKDEKVAVKFFEFLTRISTVIHLSEYAPALKDYMIKLLGS